MVARKARWLVAAVAVVSLAVAVDAGRRRVHNTPPYGSDAIAASASLRETTYDEARLLVENAPVVDEGDQLMLGTVTWRQPPQPLDGGWYVIYVIDKRTDRMPGILAFQSPNGDRVSIGSDGVDSRVAEIYPWLSGAADLPDSSGNGMMWSTGVELSVHNADAAPVTFVAFFPHRDRLAGHPPEWVPAVAPIAVSDLLVAIVYIGSDRQVYWAQRLLG